MIAVVGFAIQEFVTKQGVIDETPFFFRPFGSYADILPHSGYLSGT
jgi:hypothetical protein